MGPRIFFPTNPDLANILGDTDFDFENYFFGNFFGSQISRFPGRAWAGPGAGWLGWAGLGPWAGLGMEVKAIFYSKNYISGTPPSTGCNCS